MADTKLAKIGITTKEPWANNISYEMLDYTLWRVEDGGDGCGYIALKDNIGVTPNSDPLTWRKAAEAGQSIYQLAVKYHHFEGTEEEFEAEYQAVLQAARDAAADASAVGAQVEAAEALRVSAEASRASAESERQSAESGRASAETARATAESGRATAETARATAEGQRATAETSRQTAESGRVTAENGRASAESARVTEWGALKTDVTTARNQADAAATRANTAAGNVEADHAQYLIDHSTAADDHTQAVSDHNTATGDHTTAAGDHTTAGTDHTRAEGDHTTAGTDHGVATADHGVAETDHTRAEGDHTTAGTDHSTAQGDHTTAGTDHETAAADHTLAGTDHSTAASDHTQAGSDHTLAASDHSTAASDHTTAGTDHTTAASDHSTAGEDHTRAESDHTRAEQDHASIADKANIDGYYKGMTVGASEQLIDTKGEGSEQEISSRTSCGSSSISDDGSGVIQEIRGKSLVWNQLIPIGGSSISKTENGITFTDNRDGSYTVSGTADADVLLNMPIVDLTIPNHNYLLKGCPVGGSTLSYELYSAMFNLHDTGAGLIFNAASYNYHPALRIKVVSGTVISNPINFYPMWIDLTAMFGEGNEPSTVAEFEAMYPEKYYPNKAASMLNLTTTGLKTIGYNRYNPATGKAQIPALPSDANGLHFKGAYTALSFTGISGATSTITPDSDGNWTPTEAGEITVTGGDDSTTCINIRWSGYRDEDYEPYWEETRELPITTATSQGVAVFADGMKSAGSVYDSLFKDKAVKRIGVVDLGTLTWAKDGTYFYTLDLSGSIKSFPSAGIPNIVCDKYTVTDYTSVNTEDKTIGSASKHVKAHDVAYETAADFKAAMDGVLLYFELAEPVEYTLDAEWNNIFKVADFGTEEIVPLLDAQGNPATTELTAIIKYNDDFTREIANLPKNYVSKDALKQGTGSATDMPMSQKATTDELVKKADTEGVYDNFVAGSAKALAGQTLLPSEFTARPTGGGPVDSGLAMLGKVMGKSLVWNQLERMAAPIWSSINDDDLTYTVSEDMSTVTVVVKEGGTTGTSFIYTNVPIIMTEGHHYLLRGCAKGGSTTTYFVLNASGGSDAIRDTGSGYIFTYEGGVTNNYFKADITFYAGVPAGTYIFKPQLIDLTLMFGVGHEPVTVAEFERLYWLKYFGYNPGTIINNKSTAIETTGLNQWDEEWESGYYYEGEKRVSDRTIRSSNMIPVFPGQSYYWRTGNNGQLQVTLYDADKKYISDIYLSNGSTTIPAGCHFITFNTLSVNNITTYNHDICINRSNASRNGEYEPYKRSVINLNLDTITGKLNGEGESVVINPEGMGGQGDWADVGIVENGYLTKILKNTPREVVDLGNLGWTYYNGNFNAEIQGKVIIPSYNLPSKVICSKYITFPSGHSASWNDYNKIIYSAYTEARIFVRDTAYSDADTFKAAMSGVKITYQLATPELYVLDTPIYVGYQVDEDGTERRLPEDTASAVSAPFVAEIVYPINAVKQLNEMPKDYANVATLDALLSTLGTALNGTLTKSWNAETQKYTFTFTPNA